jgi:hypothetical protein
MKFLRYMNEMIIFKRESHDACEYSWSWHPGSNGTENSLKESGSSSMASDELPRGILSIIHVEDLGLLINQ